MLFQETPTEQRYEPQRYAAAAPAPSHSPIPIYILLGVVAIASVASLVLISGLRDRIHGLEGQVKATQDQQAKLADQQTRTNEQVNASSEMLREKLGMTKKDYVRRTSEIAQRESETEKALAQQKQETEQKFGVVNQNIDGVRTDVGGVKTDVASTKQDLAATQAKLERTIGDLGVQSGLIATNHDELEALKHSGDRNYYEFTLEKGKSKPVGTISLELKKADQKHSRFTMNVVADDNTIEKKDRELNEPVQFYTGRDHFLYELVVNKIEKNRVTGYLATPKGAPKAFQLNQQAQTQTQTQTTSAQTN